MLGFVRRLWGGGDQTATPAAADDGPGVEYKGFRIIPRKSPQGGQFLTAGVIVHDGPSGRREHRFVRADTHATADDAREFTLAKARRLIDEQGERLFEG
jgi:hypothetical protein